MTPAIVSLCAMAAAALLCAWGARRDLQIPVWATIGAFVCSATITWSVFGAPYAPLAVLALACMLIVETDRRHHLIPDVFGLAVLTLSFAMPFGDSLSARLIGAAGLGLTFLLIRQAMSSGREALGLGDVKLAAAMGAVLGLAHGFAAVAIAGIATLAVVSATIMRGKGGAVVVGAPFGIGLAAATAIVALVRAAS